MNHKYLEWYQVASGHLQINVEWMNSSLTFINTFQIHYSKHSKLKSIKLFSWCFYIFFFSDILHGDTSLGYFPCTPIRCPVGCLETIWSRWHDILNYIYFKWNNILTFHNNSIILITEVAIVIELFYILFNQVKIKESLRHTIMRHSLRDKTEESGRREINIIKFIF